MMSASSRLLAITANWKGSTSRLVVEWVLLMEIRRLIPELRVSLVSVQLNRANMLLRRSCWCRETTATALSESLRSCSAHTNVGTSCKNARLKYTIDRMGLGQYKDQVEKLLGYALEPPRPFTFDRNIDDFGWHVGEDGKHHFMMFVENGRIQDEPGRDFKTGLREIAKVHKGSFRLTANQHLMISDIPPEDLEIIKVLLAKYKMDNLNYTGLRLSSSACVAFPTCGLAMAESERVS